jgi:hypothetical protein
MKKLFLMFAAVLFFAVGAFAQLSVGAKAGLNLANLAGDDVEDSDMRSSFHVGGYLNLPISEKLSLQPELLYNSLGAKSSYDDPDFGDVTETLKLNYISLPVMLVYSFGTVNLQAGPQINFLAAAKYKIEADGESYEEDIKDGLKGTDFGFNVGLGANFGKFNATARYCLGLSSISDEDGADTKNTVIQLSLGYRIFGGAE